MSKSELTPLQKQQRLITKCKNKTVTDEFIQRYQQSTKNAIEQILKMGETVLELYELSKDGILNEHDLNYFCMNVGIDEKGSTFRKYKAIGENADRFREHLDKLPSAFSTLYEIATLDAITFEKIFIKGKNCQGLTLHQVKQLANINSPVLTMNKTIQSQPVTFTSAQIAKTVKKINRFAISIPDSLNESEINYVIQVLEDLQEKRMITFDVPDILQYENDDDDTIDYEDIDDEVAEDLKAA